MNPITDQQKTDALFGRKVTVQRNNGITEEVLLKQLPLIKYLDAFQVIRDEFSLVALLLGKERPWVTGTTAEDGLTAESFETLRTVAMEVNSYFFIWSARHQAQVAKQMEEAERAQQRYVELLANAGPEGAQKLIELGQRFATESPKSHPMPR